VELLVICKESECRGFVLFLVCLLDPAQGLSHCIQLLEVYLIRTGFILGEPVSLVKVFRLFR
jgi:hypothetical protein